MTPPPRGARAWDDDEVVATQYASTTNLDARAAVWTATKGAPSAQDLVVASLRDRHARMVLEVGAGRGELAARVARELGAAVLALDRSAAMVEAAGAIRVNSVIADVRALPVASGRFDAVVAAWMLYHVDPLDAALEEISRVLAPGGVLVAVTNGRGHLRGLWELVVDNRPSLTFSRESGARALRGHFTHVRRRDVASRAHFGDREAAIAYIAGTGRAELCAHLPRGGWPREFSGATSVFVATGPRTDDRTR